MLARVLRAIEERVSLWWGTLVSRARYVPRAYALTFVALMLLFTLAGALTGAYHAERLARARRHFQAGEAAMRQGRQAEAVEQYRTALAISRGQRTYELALALALFDLGRWQEAETHLSDLLQHDPTNGVASLAMARVLARHGRAEDAVAYYQRAIYGLWPRDPVTQRWKARSELVEYLRGQGKKQQVLSELFRLRDELPEDPEVQKRVAGLFLWAGSPAQATELFRQVIRKQRQDAGAFAGLGEAALAARDYASAQYAFRSALHLNPRAETLRQRLSLADSVLALDPTLRRLSSLERRRRSRRLVELSLLDLDQCAAGRSGELPEAARQAAESARKLLQRRLRATADSSLVEADIALAEQVRQARRDLCGPLDPDSPQARVLAKLAQ